MDSDPCCFDELVDIKYMTSNTQNHGLGGALFAERVSSRQMKMSMKKLRKYDEVEIFSNLLDSRIDICSPLVISSFKDNFDFEEMRGKFIDDCLHNVISTQRSNQKSLNVLKLLNPWLQGL